jgi:hypothetical protein
MLPKVETSTAYGMQSTITKGSRLHELYSNLEYRKIFQKKGKLKPKQLSWIAEAKNSYYGSLILPYHGNCFSYFLRFCYTEDDKLENLKFSFAKYTTANINIALGPSIYIGAEFHIVPELFGTVFFQDWDLLDQKDITRPRYKYFILDKVEIVDSNWRYEIE